MKKVYKLSIIAMLLLLSLPCRAQISSIIAEATPQFSYDSGIVRYWKDSIFISCNRDVNGDVVFSTVEHNNPNSQQVFNNHQFDRVTDFQILDDYVYFCGSTNNSGGQSVIGRFFIPDMWVGPVTFEVMEFNPRGLSKLVVYNTHCPHVVAIGNVPVSAGHAGFLVECDYHSTYGFWNLVYYIPTGTSSVPTFRDLVLTPRYVVVVADYGVICLYKCPRNNIGSGMTSYEYLYASTYNEPLNALVATAMSGDTIATAGFAFTSIYPYWSDNVRIFDLTTMDNIDAQALTFIEKGFSNDIVYLPYNGSLVVSHCQGKPTPGFSGFELVHTIPFSPISYNGDRYEINKPQWLFGEIESVWGQVVVSAYGGRWFWKDMTSLTKNCCNISTITINPIPKVPTTRRRSPYIQAQRTLNTLSWSSAVVTTTINILCK